MTMHVHSLQHDRHGLLDVERASRRVPGLAYALHALPAVQGVVVLATCNRVEVLVDAAGDASLLAALDEHFGASFAWDTFRGEAALRHVFRVAAGLESMVVGEREIAGLLRHVFRVAAGLESMVVGEREIAGQLRRALVAAQEAGQTSLALTVAIEEALRASRAVATSTGLDAAGRSVVAQALSLTGIADWSGTHALIVGTGSYAGAVVAALRSRGVERIDVHSASGRGAEFAASHDVRHVTELGQAIADADLVVTCRGRGPMVFPHHVRAGQALVDLSLTRDVDRSVDGAGHPVVDLARVAREVAPGIEEDTLQAERIVEAGIAGAMTKLRARVVDPAVTQLRETVLALVEEEVARLPQRALTRDDAAHAMRRLAARLLHVPSARAKEAAASGKVNEYLLAMHALTGIGPGPTADELDTGTCPATGLAVADLEIHTRDQETA